MSIGGTTTLRRENGLSIPIITTVTDNYTLTPQDNGSALRVNKATAVTVTVPTYLPVGFNVEVHQVGAGQVTFSASGTTIYNRQSHTKTAGQHARVFLESLVPDTFCLSGDTGT